MGGQLKWQGLSRVSALEQPLKRRTLTQNYRIDCRFNGELKDDLHYLSSRLYAYCRNCFLLCCISVNPSFGRISKRVLVESLSLETIIPSSSVS